MDNTKDKTESKVENLEQVPKELPKADEIKKENSISNQNKGKIEYNKTVENLPKETEVPKTEKQDDIPITDRSDVCKIDTDRDIEENLGRNKEEEDEIRVNVKSEALETEKKEEEEAPRAKIRWGRLLSQMLNISIGYYVFGYEVGVFNSIQGNVAFDLNWTGTDEKTYVTIVSVMIAIGAVFGAAVSGKVTAAVGRKWAFIIFDCIMIVGISITFIANTAAMIIGRFICGFSVGAYVALTPLFIHEIMPDKYIGYGSALYNIAFNVGLISAFGLGNNVAPTDQPDLVWWRVMYFFPGIFVVLNIILFLGVFKFDSPKHLLQEGDHEGCVDAYRDIYYDEEEIKVVVKALEDHLHKKQKEAEEYTFKVLCSARFAKQLLLGIVLMLGIQFCAINVFNYYSTSIFLKTMPLKEATLFTSMLGVGQLAGSIISIFIFGKFSKKKTVLAGYGILFGILFIVSILAYTNNTDPIKYLMIIFFLDFGATIFTSFEIQAEILPDIGLGVLGFVHWLVNVVVVLTLPYMLASVLDFQWTIMIYAGLLLVIIIYIAIFYKESHGKTLNEVEEIYKTWL